MKYVENNKDKEFYKDQPQVRRDSIGRLVGHLTNPGRFSVLVLAMRGAGKTHWLNEIVKNLKKNDCLTDLVTVNGFIATNTNEHFWEDKFLKAEGKLLVIDEVEGLSKLTQSILFEFLSTSDGKFGWIEKKHTCRILFTSTYDVKTLRDSEEYLLHKFFDRISQLVVTFPSFVSDGSSIWPDFRATWKKMEFPSKQVPVGEFEVWLKQNARKLHGNFRDLDKLAINWQNYQLLGLDETEIFSQVIDDFNKINHFPDHTSEIQNAFFVKEDIEDYSEVSREFKRFIRDLAKKKYGKLSKAPQQKPFGVHYRTMEGW